MPRLFPLFHFLSFTTVGEKMKYTESNRSFVFLLVLGSLALMASPVSQIHAQVIQEIPVRGLLGVAAVRYNRAGEQTIQYNPRSCARLGPDLCQFIRAHEYGHVVLNHLGRGTPRRQAEYEADVWAARNVTPQSRAAAINFFDSGRGGSFAHGTSWARSSRVVSAPITQGFRTVSRRRDGSAVAVSRGFNTLGIRTLIRRPFFRK